MDVNEYFGEVEIPIMANTPGVQELNVNFSSRLTDHEIYGDNWTWSGKLGYRWMDIDYKEGSGPNRLMYSDLSQRYIFTSSASRIPLSIASQPPHIVH